MAKDLFSGHAKMYSQFRPHYPDALYQYILSFVAEKNTAWDCATGNGQAAVQLALFFTKVIATDISAAQLAQAKRHTNINYIECAAESTPFADDTFDLVTVAQAYHWFDHGAFNNEVKRVGKNNAIIALWLYDRFKTDDIAFGALMDDFYFTITGPYWDNERKFVDEHYSSLPFPYDVLPPQIFETINYWTLEQLIGYLTSWSAVQKYIKVHDTSPIALIVEKMQALWGTEKEKKITFPIYLQLGRIRK